MLSTSSSVIQGMSYPSLFRMCVRLIQECSIQGYLGVALESRKFTLTGGCRDVICEKQYGTPLPLKSCSLCMIYSLIFLITKREIIMSLQSPCVWLQGPLIDLKPRLTSYVKPGCLLLLSGIMTTQVPSIKEVYQDEFESFRVYSDEVWSLILAVRKVGPSCSLAFDIDKLPSSFTWSFEIFVSFAHWFFLAIDGDCSA